MRWTNCHIVSIDGEDKRPDLRPPPFAGSPVAPQGWQFTRETKAMMLARVAGARAEEARAVAGAEGDLRGAAPLELSHRVLPAGEAVVGIGGELDFATAEMAVAYVRDVIDRYRGPVTVDLAALGFCDAQGLSALVRMAGCAERAGRPFRLVSPGPSVVKIMRITGLDQRFLVPPAGCPPDS
jgi:anti-sigma B factor antagonist